MTVFDTAGSFTWTCPAGVFFATLRIWNAGGAGGEDDGVTCGNGGGGGSFAEWSIFPTPGVTYDIVVGAGGVWNVDPLGGSGFGRGGNSYFGPIGTYGVISSFYQGGKDSGTLCGTSQTGYGAAGFYGPTPDILNFGGNGGCGTAANGGGGGSSAWQDETTGVGADGTDGGAGGLGGGALPRGGDGGDHGVSGSNPGGGGGGADLGGTPGDGGDGRIEIDFLLTLGADSGSFLIAGTDVDLRYWHLNADEGSFTISGSSASLLEGHRLSADSGSFTITGSSVSREVGSGSFTITGYEATFPRTYSPGNWSPGFPLPPIPAGTSPSKFPGAP